jgi:hypothetical protein
MNLSFKFYSEYICSDLFFIKKKNFLFIQVSIAKKPLQSFIYKKKTQKTLLILKRKIKLKNYSIQIEKVEKSNNTKNKNKIK